MEAVTVPTSPAGLLSGVGHGAPHASVYHQGGYLIIHYRSPGPTSPHTAWWHIVVQITGVLNRGSYPFSVTPRWMGVPKLKFVLRDLNS